MRDANSRCSETLERIHRLYGITLHKTTISITLVYPGDVSTENTHYIEKVTVSTPGTVMQFSYTKPVLTASFHNVLFDVSFHE